MYNKARKLTFSLKNREKTASVFLDVEKAFNRVWHKGLLYKIHQMGTHTNLTKIIDSFLYKRTFRVCQENSLSSSWKITAGVPQGSCLLPALYLIYINYIPLTPKANLAIFTDDTVLFTNDRNHNRAIIQLQNQLDMAIEWFN